MGIIMVYEFMKRGFCVVLIEVNQVFNGIIVYIIVKIIVQYDMIYDEFICYFGLNYVRFYYEVN